MRETTDHYNEQQIINHRVPHVSLELSHSLCHIKGNPVVLTTASLHTDVENEEIENIAEGSLKKKIKRGGLCPLRILWPCPWRRERLVCDLERLDCLRRVVLLLKNSSPGMLGWSFMGGTCSERALERNPGEVPDV